MSFINSASLASIVPAPLPIATPNPSGNITSHSTAIHKPSPNSSPVSTKRRISRVASPEINALRSHPTLGKKHKEKFPPTKLKLDDYSFLFRGCTPKQLQEIEENGTAGGVKEKESTAPTNEEAVKQVGELEKLPEFTTEISKAESFGRGNVVGFFRIKHSLLVEGSGTEGGWICKNGAEVEILGWREGQELEIRGEAVSLTPERQLRMLEKIKAANERAAHKAIVIRPRPQAFVASQTTGNAGYIPPKQTSSTGCNCPCTIL